ncbi:MAG: hypothetical protein WEC37_02685 [Anaerolineales bacterium]
MIVRFGGLSNEKRMSRLILISLLFVSSACQSASPTLATETAAATLSATATPTLIPTLDITATAVAQETVSAADLVAADLELAGYTTEQGELVWMQSEELVLFNEVANDLLSQPLEPEFTAANFIFSTDIEWNFEGIISTYGWTTCGVIFRAQDVENGEQAQFNVIFINPLAYPAWDIELWDDGQYQSSVDGELRVGSDIVQSPPYEGAYADPENPFHARNTNHFLIVADASLVTVFANGVQLGSATLDAGPTEGEFGILAGALYGRKWYEADPSVSCIFTNTWIWQLP